MLRLLALFVLWMIQAVLVILLVNAQWVEDQARAERLSIARQFGEARYADLERRAKRSYNRWFVSTHIQKQSYALLLPDPIHPKDGMLGLAPWFFQWLEHRLDAFWVLAFQAICRLQVFREWLVITGVALAAAAFDGIMQRRIKRTNHALASADKYVVARSALLLMLIAPLLYLSAPFAISPFIVPLWGAMLSVTLMLLASHAQHRI